ncbi:uncharacterized protein LOC122296975 [Carya illinoinensis]|uniref:uncharacterized protein LOC122296975 n=1 Tax=Carya illinoinensis TaxID=32201 RepID=UPI001C7216F9|nr:uncharacterized protein LOC122296975 [Carya illinoinensis]
MTHTFFRKLLTYVSSEDDSDVLNEEADGQSSRHRGNCQRPKFIQRDHIQRHERLFRDYFTEDPRRDNAERLGLFSMQKITAALRMLAYGVTGDFMDEYIHIGESTTMESLKKFSETIVSVFSDEYLRSPNANDIARLLVVGEQRGFPGMLGSIDCMHWKWKNCPAAWKCMYSAHIREPTIILEAIALYDLWIWHAVFGMPGSHNDINVLERSFIFMELVQGRAPPVNYTINGNNYIIHKTIPSPRGNKKKNFVKAQESTRKDIECAFGVLQQ